MIKQVFRQYIADADFKSLFNALGWNRYQGLAEFNEEIDGFSYHFRIVGQIKGFQVIVCDNAEHITASLCKRIDYKLRPSAQSYICIFKLPNEHNALHHIWAIPIRKPEKKDIVLIEYTSLEQTELLYQKIDGISFGVNEQSTITISDVRERIYNTFEVNSERLTRDFYTGFRRQHTAFCNFITGINDHVETRNNRDKQWYASVMLNRLMFCYFIQKKGFLNNDKNYLQTKLAWCQLRKGTDQFYSFYKSFLLQLFFGGLNAPKHDTSFEQEFGRIPYLNGGMFDKHQLERDYENIEICDEAFQQLFNFFDRWEWHLDTRVTASGRDINPDVLGYIFEQYINDRAQMGAYYTKEDITEYIGKNCILPFLMDKLKEQDPDAFKPNSYVWQSLQHSGDKYIYEAVKKGANAWDEIPAEIAQGIDTTQPNLLERRAHWNNTTPEQWALPTEIWRESIERMQRCRDIQSKISKGEITEINDFITFNLDIRTFVQDLLEKTDDHLLVLHFHKALTQVSILDPTCGSGAFLFAAMNILEPLYETCINRMIEFNATNAAWFKDILADLHTKYRSNIQYYIYKTIILNNLYGVDIMHEAVEIAKLRLFLKMVAVVDVDMRADNLGLDPLPDIDFNIRCGNTLVGYATEKELHKDLVESDMFAQQEFQEKIEREMELVAQTFKRFRGMQLTQNVDDLQEFKETKHELNTRLAKLNDTLNHKMYQSITAGGQSYESWLTSHQPFHWLAEYYHIINGNGGFDVIIGNPPYVEYSQIRNLYKIGDYSTIDSGNLYSFVIERSFNIMKSSNYIGMIIPISAFCTARMESLMNLFLKKASSSYISNYAERPGKLFEGAERNLSIFISQLQDCTDNKGFVYTTTYYKWKAEHRNLLFHRIIYFDASEVAITPNFPKIGYLPELNVLKKLQVIRKNIGFYSRRTSDHVFYYKNSGGRYWKFMATFKPLFYLNGAKSSSSRETHLYFDTDQELSVFTSILNSTLYFWFYVMNSDARTNNPSDLKDFPIVYESIDSETNKKLQKLCVLLMKELQKNAVMTDAVYRTGDVSFAQYLPAKSKPIIDEIDKVLAKHYGFTEEELDFIINYDIKYRMGDELNNE